MRALFTAIGIISILFLAGCSSPTPRYDSNTLNGMLQPLPSRAKLIVYYPSSRVWSDQIASVKAAGRSGCRLKSGHFLTSDIAPGIQTVSVSLCNGNEISSLRINARAGIKYYVQVVPNDKSLAGRIAASGTVSTEGRTHAEGSAFTLDLVGEEAALKQLPFLRAIP